MEEISWTDATPRLRAPILVTAFEGWFDVGGAATGALEWLTQRSDAAEIAQVDPDGFFDFSERRPYTRIEQNRRVIDWPDTRVHALTTAGERDLVVMVGVEPHLRWRAFVDTVEDAAQRTGAKMVVTLGAALDEVPHSRPLEVSGSAPSAEMAAAMRLDRPSYEGPTGVVGVMHERFGQLGLPAVSLRVSVPHYVSGSPNPKASRALLERFERITGLATGWAELDDAAREWEARVDEAVADDEDVATYVRRLEELADARVERDLPSPDDLAADFERFLRQQDD